VARIGVIAHYATGHLDPSISLARSLGKQGHEPIFFSLPDTAIRIIDAGLAYIPYGGAAYPAGSLKVKLQKAAELTGEAAHAYYIERTMSLFHAGFEELPYLLKRERLDLLVVDQAHYHGSTIAEHLNVPFVSLVNALPVNREDSVPPWNTMWPLETSEAAIERNRQGWVAFDRAYAPLLSLVNRQRESWGLPLHTNLQEDSFSRLAQICQIPPSLEFPRTQASNTLHLVGPLRDEQLSGEVPFSWEWLDDRPLIYASCGTIQNRLENVFRAMIEACAPFQAQTIISLGGDALTPTLFGSVPPNIKVVPYAPQRPLLERASLCINHAGLNTVLDSLEFGVPMVSIPIASDQPGTATRTKRLGAATVIPVAELSAARLSLEIQSVLANSSYREAAKAAAEEIGKLNPVAEAVRIIERVLSVGNQLEI
jgi:zeaxanthin glucosyltransferase